MADKIAMETTQGPVTIELRPDLAPKHVERIKTLANENAYDGVAFHRVIEGFMAQTGDVQYGKEGMDPGRAGTGGSDKPDLPQEFSDERHVRGTCSMARTADPNSANSQFFICFEDTPHLDRQYTVWGKVTDGMENVDKLKKGAGSGGSVTDPDRIVSMTVVEG